MRDTHQKWERRFRNETYPTDPDPSPLLLDCIETAADPERGDGTGNRALDVATGTGRNAIPLAEAGYTVDAVDQSRAGLRLARSRARERDVADRMNWIQADVSTIPFPTSRYALVAISFYRAIDRFSDIKRSLAPGGILFVEHHLRTTDPVEFGSSDDRFRLASNELLRSCLDLTVLHYEERTEILEDGRRSAIAEIIARKSSGDAQSYPHFDRGRREGDERTDETDG